MAVANFQYITRMSSGFKVYILEGKIKPPFFPNSSVIKTEILIYIVLKILLLLLYCIKMFSNIPVLTCAGALDDICLNQIEKAGKIKR